ncbi:MAG: HEPN domain-containing protein [Brevinematales bacterium]|nr:HEPN domain-containing protein [Brevinematales bacterium]
MAKDLDSIIERWKYKADVDIRTIESLLENNSGITESVCFHAQQAVEKYLKLFLVSREITPPKTHNIRLLLNECETLHSDFSS